MAVPKLSKVQAKGQITIPVAIRQKLGLEKGDVVAFVETERGVLISPQEVVALEALEQIGEALKECGDFAGEYGIKLMLEVHGRGTSLPRHIRTIMDVCDHPQVGVTWNCNATDIEDGSIKANFGLLAKWMLSAHIHDLYEDYPYQEFIALLKQIGFTGFCLIEMPESCEPERLLKYYSRLWGEWTR